MERAAKHDLSKFEEDEFGGFVKINQVAREHPYGSEEYKNSLRGANKESGCIALHNARNDHHPEHYADPKDMGFLQIIEMVVDWYSASKTYGQSNSFKNSLEIQRKRFDRFSEEQWWLIEQVAAYISSGETKE